MHVPESRLDAIFGSGLDRDRPTTPPGIALARINALDDQMSLLAEEGRQPGESRETAYARMLDENPHVYDRYEKARRAILVDVGLADAWPQS